MKATAYAITLVFLLVCSNQLKGQVISDSSPQKSTNTTSAVGSAIDQQTIKEMLEEYKYLNSKIESDEKLRELEANYKSLSEKIESNAKETDKIGLWAEIFFGIFALIFGVGSAASMYGWVKTEQRTKESHQLAMESYQLAMRGERTGQVREESIFEQSKTTLTLVNETLGLAKEASTRASKSLENKLKKSAKELEKSSSKLIDESGAFKDDRQLVRKKEITSRIHSLGNKIKGLANNIVILEDDTIELDPFCDFISGIDSHLREDYADAIENLERATTHKAATEELKSLAHYWLGYINNNLREFEAAILNFSKAFNYATGPRKYEIRRILLESRFFLKEDGKELIKEFTSLLSDFDSEYRDSQIKEVRDKRVKIQNTLGNIYYQVGNETSDREAGKQYYQLAKEQFESSISSVDSKAPEHMWVLFGLAEAKYKLGDVKEAAEILKTQVMRAAEKEYLNREELRTKVLAKTTQLICCVRSGENQYVKDCRDEVISVLGDVDSRLTIYSQFQRRNVAKTEFYKEIDALTDPILKANEPAKKES